MGPDTPERYFTRKEAAALCGVSVDTIKRAQKAGRLPGVRQRPACSNNTLEIPYTDLVNAGLYSPPPAADSPQQELQRIQDDKQLRALAAEVESLRGINDDRAARIDALERRNDQLIKSLDRFAASLARADR